MKKLLKEVQSEVEDFIKDLSTRKLVVFKTENSRQQLSIFFLNALKPFVKWASLQEFEVRFSCENTPIAGEYVNFERLNQGYIDILAEQFGCMPMFQNKMINVIVKPLEG